MSILRTDHPLLDGLQGLWLPLPHLAGGTKLYDISGRALHGTHTMTWAADGERGLYLQRGGGVNTGVSHDVTTPYTVGGTFRFSSDSTSGLVSVEDEEIQADGDDLVTDIGSLDGVSIASGVSGAWFDILLIAAPVAGTVKVVLDGKLALDTTYTPNSGSHEIKFGQFTSGFTRDNVDVKTGYFADRAMSVDEAVAWTEQARRGFPDLLRRRTLVSLATTDTGEAVSVSQDATSTVTTTGYDATVQTGTPVTVSQDATSTVTTTGYDATVVSQDTTVSQDATSTLTTTGYDATVTTTSGVTVSQDATSSLTTTGHNATVQTGPAVTASQDATSGLTTTGHDASVQVGPAVSVAQDSTSTLTTTGHDATVFTGVLGVVSDMDVSAALKLDQSVSASLVRDMSVSADITAS